MLQRTIITLCSLVLALGSNAQSSSDFKFEKIDKQVKYFPLDSMNLSSPLDYYLSRAQVRLSGKYKNWQNISTSMFDFSANIPDEVIDDNFRNYVLNEKIDYIVTYRDSVASIVTHSDGEDIFLLNNCWLEDGRWVNRGQGLAESWDDAQEQLFKRLPEALYNKLYLTNKRLSRAFVYTYLYLPSCQSIYRYKTRPTSPIGSTHHRLPILPILLIAASPRRNCSA